MEIGAYLERIGYSGTREPTVKTLKQLHRAHMCSVPFENLDIHLGRPTVLSLASFYDKIVRCRRGGFCYELNGLFGWLLEQLGFTVVMLSARVFKDTQPGAEFDHMLLLIEMEEARLIADVGFGDSFLEPLPLDSSEAHEQYGSMYRLTGSETEKMLQRLRGSDWSPQYIFALKPRQLDEFSVMCQYQQTSPESHFTQKTVCSLATVEGRVTLSNNRLIVTADGQRKEQEVLDGEAYQTLLKTYFGIELAEGAPIHKLMAPTNELPEPI
ncbi:MAG: arylamine N-acetyltransferase [Cyanobacteria bacterium P01_G01_bin.38]